MSNLSIPKMMINPIGKAALIAALTSNVFYIILKAIEQWWRGYPAW